MINNSLINPVGFWISFYLLNCEKMSFVFDFFFLVAQIFRDITSLISWITIYEKYKLPFLFLIAIKCLVKKKFSAHMANVKNDYWNFNFILKVLELNLDAFELFYFYHNNFRIWNMSGMALDKNEFFCRLKCVVINIDLRSPLIKLLVWIRSE